MTTDHISTNFATHSSRRIHRIAQLFDAKSYLEIGVCEGSTFLDIQMPRKVAVDPKFRFDYSKHVAPGSVDFYETTSDLYFCGIATSEMFDIIFLDGMHTFQQTLRDLLNSLTLAHSRTIWLIDDVLPSDVYSSLPSSADAHGFRKRAGGSSLAWHGDVYKLIYFIHDFIPSLSFATITTKGNPQTIIWRQGRADFSPILNSVEQIERLTYFDHLKNMGITNAFSEDDAFSLLAEVAVSLPSQACARR